MAFGPRSLPPEVEPGEVFYACPFCELCFESRKKLDKHVKEEHKVKMQGAPS